MPAFQKVIVNGPNFFEKVIKPSLGDNITDLNVRNGFFGEFTVMDDVPFERRILDIKRMSNILERRDASCGRVYKNVGSASLRKVTTTELVGAVKYCPEEFYQGCLKDWEAGNPVFIKEILNFFKMGIRQDLASLMYFGDMSRAESSGAYWNTNKIDGVFTQLKKYVQDETIPAAQTFNIDSGEITATEAKQYFDALYGKQDTYLKMLPKSEKAFYVGQALADAYEDYLHNTSNQGGAAVNFIQDGIQVRAFKGIPIFVNPIYDPVLSQINGNDAHFGMLTIRGNNILATDKNYGTGANRNQALVVWYDEDTEEWKYKTALRLGTQVAFPEHSVLGLPS